MTEPHDPSGSGPQPGPPARRAIDRLARSPRLLVACDYDGTLAPIVSDPARARPLPESIVALRSLGELPDTYVAVISGRALDDLATMTGLREHVHLVGSHGSEFDPGFVESLTEEQQALLGALRSDLAEIAGRHAGLALEHKPASVALHYRNVPGAVAAQAVRDVEAGPAARPGAEVKRGKMVIELSVIAMHKGVALNAIRQRVGAQAVLFLGDDTTDEDAFGQLSGPDLGVKVGPGTTAARARVADPEAVAQLLARVCERRSAWLCGEQAVPIDHHAMLSDERTVALVTPQAGIVWMCVPRVDSPALFADLLGGPSAGAFRVRPADGSESVDQHYEESTLVLATHFRDFRVTDFLDCSGGRTRQRAGRSDLVRIVEGTGRVRIEFAPRLDFGRNPTRLAVREGGIEIQDLREPIVLYAPGVRWRIDEDGQHQTAVAEVELGGEPLVLQLRIGVGSLRAPTVNGHPRLEQTREYWRHWAGGLRLPGVAREAVLRSALTIRGLVHGPSGGITAAATTSLPESIGGSRNWDYRYCWPRDASIAAASLVRLGSLGEAMHLLDWLLEVVERAAVPERMHPIYTVTGDELGTEGEIGELAGYACSRPVRVGNAASRQMQLDVFGPVADLVHELAIRDAPLSPQHWRVVEAMVAAVQSAWQHPDHGIWEVRGAPAHYVHSKVMCWVTLDRAIRSARLLRDAVPRGWEELRERIREDVLARGWNDRVGAFVSAYGRADPDAATLSIGLSGMLPADDKRFLGTIGHVERELRRGAGVHRYRFDDNLSGNEGTFHLCTAWLIMSQVLVGRVDDAARLFDDYLDMLGPTGLMPEEHDTERDIALGNHPQAYSHAGLIDCALLLDRARRG